MKEVFIVSLKVNVFGTELTEVGVRYFSKLDKAERYLEESTYERTPTDQDTFPITYKSIVNDKSVATLDRVQVH